MSPDKTLPPPLPRSRAPEIRVLPQDALAVLSWAIVALERTSFAGHLASLAGAPIDVLKGWLPERLQGLLDATVRRALSVAAKAALRSRPGREVWVRSAWFHRGLTAASGVVGGTFGLPGTLAELPVSTSILVRQIAAIAVEEGEDPADPTLAAECLKVFALGNRDASATAEPSDYFAVRVALAQTLRTAASRGAAGILMPGFIGAIAARFAGPVALKLSAQSAPIVGAAAGAAVNLAFLEHFRRLARAHFAIRRLERQFGMDPVQHAYVTLRAQMDPT